MSDSTEHKTQSLFSREEVNAILAQGYPSDAEIERFPLGHILKEIPLVNDRYGMQIDRDTKQRTKPGHIQRVMSGANLILAEKHQELVPKLKDKEYEGQNKHFREALIDIMEGHHDAKGFLQIDASEWPVFFRLCALYHDIGKHIIHERHPHTGWHLIRDVHQEDVERNLYPCLLDVSYDQWEHVRAKGLNARQKRLIALFESVIRFHDLFGVLSTGEGSLPVMVDLIRLTGTSVEDAQELFSVLMLLNLADLYGSVHEIEPYKVEAFYQDWRLLCDTIKKAKGKRAEFFKLLLDTAQDVECTINRIKRLAKEETSDDWKRNIDEKVEEILQGAVLGGLHTFCTNFALFCKLDYGLAFKRQIFECAKKENLDVTRPLAKVIWLLAQLERQYGDLCKRGDGTWRRLGVELAGLTRKSQGHANLDKPTIGNTLSQLLLKTEEKGKEWAIGECTVWFLEE